LTTYIIIIFAVSITAGIAMGRKFLELLRIIGGKPCKPVVMLNVYMGATLGLLLWSCIIGFFINDFTKATFVGSTASIIPCFVGVLHIFKLNKICNPQKCSDCEINK